MSETKHFYRIGTPGAAWDDAQKAAWLADVGTPKRTYKDDVLNKLTELKEQFDVEQYGELSQDPSRYPLFVIKTREWNSSKPSVLITGGTHGYETSGVQGALLFASTEMAKYAAHFNIAVCPCVSPWSYECIQRWNPKTIDPNRHYIPDSPCEECAAVVRLVEKFNIPQWTMHMDLHETTDTDSSEFMPAKASRDGLEYEEEDIPDGFYLIGCSEKPQAEWHKAMIDAVREITHIAPADKDGKIMGKPVSQEGVIDSNTSGLGKFVTNATYATTTEVYPDSKSKPVSGEQCNRAQVACITAGLSFIIAQSKAA